MEDAFKTRERALENQFFLAVDRALVERMREQLSTEDARRKLGEATGMSNARLLDELVAAGVDETTLVAFVLLPLAQVAWADGHVDDQERQLVVNTALSLGYSPNSPGLELLVQWLETAPGAELFRIWCDYASRIVGGLSQISRRELTSIILRRILSVAAATGGVLGVGNTSAAEHEVIRQVQTALSNSTGN